MVCFGHHEWTLIELIVAWREISVTASTRRVAGGAQSAHDPADGSPGPPTSRSCWTSLPSARPPTCSPGRAPSPSPQPAGRHSATDRRTPCCSGSATTLLTSQRSPAPLTAGYHRRLSMTTAASRWPMPTPMPVRTAGRNPRPASRAGTEHPVGCKRPPRPLPRSGRNSAELSTIAGLTAALALLDVVPLADTLGRRRR